MSAVALPVMDSRVQMVITAFQCIVAATAYYSQRAAPTPYSKMAAGQEKTFMLPVRSRLGMFVIYTPAFAYCTQRLYSLPLGSVFTDSVVTRAWLLTVLLAAHFGKRVFEVAFVHKYTGVMDGAAGAFVSCAYAGACALILEMFDATISPDIISTKMLVSGLVIFIVGQMGNGYHHLLLANLKRTDEKKYCVPAGGLFEYVATPHYLFEIMSWFSFFLVSQQLNTLLTSLIVTMYLTGRAVTTNEWNRQNIPNYPTDRKNMFPGLF